MLRRSLALLVALAAAATAVLPSALICRCLASGERMALWTCCPDDDRSSAPTLSASCCATEDPPRLDQRASPEARRGAAGVPTLVAVSLAAAPSLPPATAGRPSAALARGRPAGLLQKRDSQILRI